MTAPTPDIARLDADLQLLAQQKADRLKCLMVAAHQYDVAHLDSDSQYTLPDSYPVSYLPAGGQS